MKLSAPFKAGGERQYLAGIFRVWASVVVEKGVCACADDCSHLAVYHMRETGWIKVSQTDVLDLHHKYADMASCDHQTAP